MITLSEFQFPGYIRDKGSDSVLSSITTVAAWQYIADLEYSGQNRRDLRVELWVSAFERVSIGKAVATKEDITLTSFLQTLLSSPGESGADSPPEYEIKRR